MNFTKIIIDSDIKTKEELFSYIGQIFEEEKVVKNADDFIIALNEREAQISTGLMDGIAIPHGKCDTVLSSGVLVIKLATPIAYETLDGSQVKYVFALAIPEHSKNHLETLSQLSVKLMDPSCRKDLERTNTIEEINNIFA